MAVWLVVRRVPGVTRDAPRADRDGQSLWSEMLARGTETKVSWSKRLYKESSPNKNERQIKLDVRQQRYTFKERVMMGKERHHLLAEGQKYYKDTKKEEQTGREQLKLKQNNTLIACGC